MNELTKLLRRRKGDRLFSNATANIKIYSEAGKFLSETKCFIENISKKGVGLRIKVPLFKGDRVELDFFHRGDFVLCQGDIVRDISWSQKTGVRLDRIIF